MARPSNTEQRRAQIAHGLMKVMAKRGYDGASIAEVAAAARLTPGLVHYHFKDKREILLAALGELVALHDARLSAACALAGGNARKELDAFIDFHLGLGSTADPQAMVCWILFTAEALRDAKVRAVLEQALATIVARLTAAIRRGIEQRVFRCIDAKAAASALVATIHGYFVLAATARELIPRGSAAEATKKMAAGLLGITRGKERRS
jgi:TetR/AcrR family transcriptional regulator, transcriptional repressor of bet genes